MNWSHAWKWQCFLDSCSHGEFEATCAERREVNRSISSLGTTRRWPFGKGIRDAYLPTSVQELRNHEARDFMRV